MPEIEYILLCSVPGKRPPGHDHEGLKKKTLRECQKVQFLIALTKLADKF